MSWVLDTPTWELRLLLKMCAVLGAMPLLQLYISMELAERESIVERLNADVVTRAVHELRDEGHCAWAAPGGEA